MPVHSLADVSIQCFLPQFFGGRGHPLGSGKKLSVDLVLCCAKEYNALLTQKMTQKTKQPQELRSLHEGASFLQSSLWGGFKQSQGWAAHYFYGFVSPQQASKHSQENREDGRTQQSQESQPSQQCNAEEADFCLLVLTRSLLPRFLPPLLSLAYIPFGPTFFPTSRASKPWLTDARAYFALCGAIGRELLGQIPLSCFFVRQDSPVWQSWGRARPQAAQSAAHSQRQFFAGAAPPAALRQAARDSGFRAAVQRVQVPDTLLLDLGSSQAELLAQMHKKHRYNIRLAEKKGVQVREVPWEQGLAAWYALYQRTAERDRIGIHALGYYRGLFQQAQQGGQPNQESGALCLYLAFPPEKEGEQDKPLAGIIVLHYGKSATYLYGASADQGRELMPNYALQWHAICAARRAGLHCYDFFGLAARCRATDPLYGLYRFKVGFGGDLVHRLGAWDLPYSQVFYALYRLLEYGRLALYRWRHRQLG